MSGLFQSFSTGYMDDSKPLPKEFARIKDQMTLAEMEIMGSVFWQVDEQRKADRKYERVQAMFDTLLSTMPRKEHEKDRTYTNRVWNRAIVIVEREDRKASKN